MNLIALFTDFGLAGPYIGQVQAVLARQASGIPIVNLCADVPVFNPRIGAYLLAAFRQGMPPGTVYLCVIDPGVGTAQRKPVALQADGDWFVGPDNGLFDVIRADAQETQEWEICWRPERVSDSFHGRDLFAPIAAAVARGADLQYMLSRSDADKTDKSCPLDLAQVIYIDHYGNALTGVRGTTVKDAHVLIVGGRQWHFARTFGAVSPGQSFWYRNSCGLVELAVNQSSAALTASLKIGDRVQIKEGSGSDA